MVLTQEIPLPSLRLLITHILSGVVLLGKKVLFFFCYPSVRVGHETAQRRALVVHLLTLGYSGMSPCLRTRWFPAVFSQNFIAILLICSCEMRAMIFFLMWIKLQKSKLKSVIKDCSYAKSADRGLSFAGQLKCPSLQLRSQGDPVLSHTWRQGQGRRPSSRWCFPQKTNFPEESCRKSLELKGALSSFYLSSECRPRRSVGTLGEEGLRDCSLMVLLHQLTLGCPIQCLLMSFPLLHTNKVFKLRFELLEALANWDNLPWRGDWHLPSDFPPMASGVRLTLPLINI